MSGTGRRPDWIAVDWGPRSGRAWALGHGGRVLATVEGDGGFGIEGFEAGLLSLIGGWLGGRTEVVVAGAPAAPWRAVPCPPVDAAALAPAAAADARMALHLVPGLKQDRPADVLRGAEVRIAGALALAPRFDGLVCLPGALGRWATVSAGEVVGFRTAMTGELFALLSGQSVLRHAMGEGEPFDLAAFDEGVAEGLARPDRLPLRLFRIRAESLLSDLAAAEARGRLSGLLVGAELAAARAWWLGQDILIVGAPGLSALYDRALRAQGLAPRCLPADRAALAGLTLARGQG